jgi:hypothetical protein
MKDVMMENISTDMQVDARNRIALAYLCLVREGRFLNLKEEQKLKLIRETINFGDAVARGIENEFATTEPRKIAGMLGLKVVGDEGGMYGSLLKRSELKPRSKEIIIYRDSLNKLMREVSTLDLSDRIMKLLIAHELFHYFEHTRYGSTSRRIKVTKWKFGPFSWSIRLKGVSEVAAHAFAETLLEIKESPVVFDYMTYILYSSRGRC